MRKLIIPALLAVLAVFLLSCSLCQQLLPGGEKLKEALKTVQHETYQDKLKKLLNGLPIMYVVTNNGGGSITIMDSKTDAKIDTIPVGEKLNNVAMDPYGNELYITTYEGDRVLIIDIKTKKVVKTLQLKDGPASLAFHPDGSKVYITHMNSNYVSVIDTKKREVTKTIQVGQFPYPIVISFDGTRAYVGHYLKFELGEKQTIMGVEVPGMPKITEGSKEVVVIDLKTDKVIARIPLKGFCRGLAISPNGKILYASTASIDVSGLLSGQAPVAGAQDTVTVIDATKNVVIKEIPFELGSGPSNVAVTPDGKEVYSICGATDAAYVIDTSKNEVKTRIPLDVGG